MKNFSKVAKNTTRICIQQTIFLGWKQTYGNAKCSATMEKILTNSMHKLGFHSSIKPQIAFEIFGYKTYFAWSEDNYTTEFKNLLHIFATNGGNLDEAERKIINFCPMKTLWNTTYEFVFTINWKIKRQKSEESDSLSKFMGKILWKFWKIQRCALKQTIQEAHKKIESMIEKDFEKYDVDRFLSFENCRFLRKLGHKYSNKKVEYIDMFMQKAKIEQQKYDSEIKPTHRRRKKSEAFISQKHLNILLFHLKIWMLWLLDHSRKKLMINRIFGILAEFWQLTNVHTFKETLANLNVDVEVVNKVIKHFEEFCQSIGEDIGSGRGGNNGNGGNDRGGNGGGGPSYSSFVLVLFVSPVGSSGSTGAPQFKPVSRSVWLP